MFDRLIFADELERVEFEKYVKIRGKFVFKQIYDYLLNFDKEKVDYTDISSCIRYDKNMRDTLYIYLATFEEYLRTQLYDRYEIKESFTTNRKEKNDIKKMAENMYECTDNQSSVLYKMFNLDLGKTISLVTELKMFGAARIEEFDSIRILRNKVMHHNLLVLGNAETIECVEKNKGKMKKGIMALANNLPDGYGQNFIKVINDLQCDFHNYKITIEA